MKIHGPSSLKNQPTQGSKKSKVNSPFHTFLEAEIAGIKKDATSTEENFHPHSEGRQAQLVEEAARLLDHALEQLTHGEKPGEEILSSIQQLRRELHHQQQGEVDESLQQANTLLAVEVERLNNLQR